MAKKKNKIWLWVGVAGLVGVGIYMYTKSKGATPATTQPPLGLPPSTTGTSTPLPSTAVTDADRAIVMQIAQSDGRQSWLNFANNGDPADIAAMANIIRTEWNVSGRCVSPQCSQIWAGIVQKYKIV